MALSKIPKYIGIGGINKDLNKQYFERIGGFEIVVPRVINLGGWDMDATASLVLTLPTDIKGNGFKAIEDISLKIFKDDGTESFFGSLMGDNIEVGKVSSSSITITRKTGGIFDSTDYDDSSINRGTATLWISR